MNNASLELGGDNWAAKDGNLLGYAVGDSSGKYVPNEFTFTRGSNLSATRVNADGYIEKGYENTLLGSNDWAQSDSQYEITGGEAGYDGTNDAWLVNKLAAAYFGKGGVSISSVATISIYAKAGSLDKLLVFFAGESARFDLTNVTAVKSGGGTIGQSIELVSGTTDWYRCSLVINVTSSGNLLIKPLNSSNQDVTGTMYIQDAMINQGLAALPYVESGASTAKAGTLENEPRIDYSSGTASLLLEPQRTNLVEYSEYFDAWNVKNNITLTSNFSESPEGLNNSTKITSTGGVSTIRIDLPVTIGDSYTFSFYIKNIDATNIKLEIYDRANFFIEQNIENNISTSVWTRYTYTFTSTNTASNATFEIKGFTGSFEIWGAQVEQDATYETSYIPTYGTSQTRAGDNCFTNNSLLKQTSATYFLETTPIEILSNNLIEVRGNGGTSNRVVFQANANGSIRVLVRAQGSSILDQNVGSVVSRNTKVKLALKYTPSNISFFVDGVKKIDTDVSVDFSPELNGLDLEGSETANDDALKQHQFLFFPEALSDADCITLTTI